MKNSCFTQKMVLAALIGIFMAASVSGAYLVNSEDWKDVYSASYNSYSENETPYFVRNNNLGVFNVLPYGEPVNIVESSDSPMISGIKSQVRNQGYEVGEVTMVDSANFKLRPEDNEKIVVVPEDYPSAALVAAPYARVTDSWVLIANGENVDQVEQIVEDSERSVMIGDFNREVSSALNGSIDERITSSSKFNLSVKVAKKYLEKEESDRVLISSGNYISRDIMEGESPVLISGTNYLPERLENFLLEDPDHGIDTSVMIGNEMANVGQDIRDLNFTRNNETTEDKMTVFVKYGQARGDSGSIYAISLFPVPTGDVSLSIPSATYNPETGEILITYRNTGESRMYQLTSFEIISGGEVIATGSDENPVFVGGNTNRTISYDTGLNGTIDEASVEFSTTYGTTPQQLDTYLTESGQFSPPLMTNLTTKEIEDSSNMSIGSVEYVKGLERFRVTVENHEDEAGFAQIRLTDVTVTGEQQSFSSDRKEVPAEGSSTFYIPAELDRIDLQQNQRVNTVISHGEERDLLVKSNVESRELETVERTVTPVMVGAAAVVLILVGGGFLAYRRLDIEIEVNS